MSHRRTVGQGKIWPCPAPSDHIPQPAGHHDDEFSCFLSCFSFSSSTFHSFRCLSQQNTNIFKTNEIGTYTWVLASCYLFVAHPQHQSQFKPFSFFLSLPHATSYLRSVAFCLHVSLNFYSHTFILIQIKFLASVPSSPHRRRPIVRPFMRPIMSGENVTLHSSCISLRCRQWCCFLSLFPLFMPPFTTF